MFHDINNLRHCLDERTVVTYIIYTRIIYPDHDSVHEERDRYERIKFPSAKISWTKDTFFFRHFQPSYTRKQQRFYFIRCKRNMWLNMIKILKKLRKISIFSINYLYDTQMDQKIRN